MSKLINLTISSCKNVNVINIHKFENITQLTLEHMMITHDILYSISISTIIDLTLMLCKYYDIDQKYNMKLDTLHMEEDVEDDDTLYMLSNQLYIKNLYLKNCNVTDNGIKKLELLSLTSLYIEDCNHLSDNGIINIMKKFPYLNINVID